MNRAVAFGEILGAAHLLQPACGPLKFEASVASGVRRTLEQAVTATPPSITAAAGLSASKLLNNQGKLGCRSSLLASVMTNARVGKSDFGR